MRLCCEYNETISIQITYRQILDWWHQQNINQTNKLKILLNGFTTLFAYHCGNIENHAITYRLTKEIFDSERVVDFSGKMRTLWEICNLKHCMDHLFTLFDTKAPISIPLIRQTNYLLCKYKLDTHRYIDNGERAGEFKKHDYVVGINDKGTPSHLVEKQLDELIDEINDAALSDHDILTTAAYFHSNFERIPPFCDGNGRTGRMLLNYYLLCKNHPPLIIYTEDKMAYYGALEAYDSDDTIKPMIDFLKVETIKTWSNHLS